MTPTSAVDLVTPDQTMLQRLLPAHRHRGSLQTPCHLQIEVTSWSVGALAGAAGVEPANAGTKNRCLTTWRRPSARAAYSDCAALGKPRRRPR